MKRKKGSSTTFNSILTGIAAGILLFALLSVLTAFLITKKDMTDRQINYIFISVLILSSFVCGFICKKKSKLKGITAGLLPSSVFTVFVFILTVFLNRFSFDELTFLLLPIGILSGTAGGIISSNLR